MNEDPTKKLISELKKEIESLKAQISGQREFPSHTHPFLTQPHLFGCWLFWCQQQAVVAAAAAP